MGKTWNVMVDGIGYYVELKNNKQAVVNGAVYNLKEHRKRPECFRRNMKFRLDIEMRF